MVLVVLGVALSLKCLVLYLHVVEERSVASIFPGSSQTHRNRMQQQTVNICHGASWCGQTSEPHLRAFRSDSAHWGFSLINRIDDFICGGGRGESSRWLPCTLGSWSIPSLPLSHSDIHPNILPPHI